MSRKQEKGNETWTEYIWYRFYLLNRGVKLKRKCKAIIPSTKMCHDFLKDFSPEKSHHRKKARPTKRCALCYKNNE